MLLVGFGWLVVLLSVLKDRRGYPVLLLRCLLVFAHCTRKFGAHTLVRLISPNLPGKFDA